ncbi:MAG: acyl-CoA desaturase [Deltaproteobacteria bacterium]|nr:acyl-CoA desaturase [Deltaproteobacteria bacterium]
MAISSRSSKVRPASQIGFLLVHLLPFAALYTGATRFDWIVCGVLYLVRMFFVTAGYHRYFAHRTYKTSRFFQFVLAFMAQTSAQKGVLWWSANHRTHHKYSDTEKDPHSMKRFGFWYSHVGWIMVPDYEPTRFELVKDLQKYPELVWLNRYYLIPPILLGALVTITGGVVNGGSIHTAFSAGWSTLWIGFFLSTVILYHATFSINSLMHRFGRARYKTGDESKNSLWLALISLGEGWHNNHHYYQRSTRQGFYWWEIDLTYYGLKVLQYLGLVWDLHGVPEHVRSAPDKLTTSSRASNA